MLAFHRLRETWMDKVNCYIALTNHSRNKFIDSGLPAEKIVVKSNSVYADPGSRDQTEDCALFIGRFSQEKGLGTLLSAWRLLEGRPRLKIAGDGPLRQTFEDLVAHYEMSNVHFEGQIPRGPLIETLKKVRFLVFPSECHESFGMTLVESFACGVPVIASRLGAMEEIVEDGRTGLHFKPGDSVDLAAKIGWAWTHPAEMEAMGRAARAEYELKYTAEHNYQKLMDIYRWVIAGCRAPQRPAVETQH